MIPLIAIVGRPNVGKSTLFNRLIRSRTAIVQDDPGVTRDRHYGLAKLDDRPIQLVDTGGFEPDADLGLEAMIRQQTELAIDEADLILLVLDARQGLMGHDAALAKLLRKADKRVVVAANKVDGPTQEALVGELYGLGVAEVWPISAEHGLGIDDLVDALLMKLPPAEAEGGAAAYQGLRVALVGRPNAGKSSLLNALVGEERAIVSEQPGTTRDPVDVRLETPEGPVVLVDTAGIRRIKRKNTTMEHYAMVRAMRSIADADVALLVIDAAAGPAEQDAKVAGMALEAGRGLVLVLTKSDLLPKGRAGLREVKQQIDDQLHFVSFAPVVFASAVSRHGVKRLLSAAVKIHRSCGKRIKTAELNRFLEVVTTAHVAPTHRGHPVRFYYITQPQSHPPTFIVSTNSANGVHMTYRRYIINKLRERFGFEGAPIRLFLRQHSGRAADDPARPGKPRKAGRAGKASRAGKSAQRSRTKRRPS
jgi:GTPase